MCVKQMPEDVNFSFLLMDRLILVICLVPPKLIMSASLQRIIESLQNTLPYNIDL